MAKRIKRSVRILGDRQEAESVVGEICTHLLEGETLTAQMNQELQAVRNRFEEAISNHDAAVKDLLPAVQLWADSHPEEFGKRKSLEMLHAIVGYRTGQPKISPLPGWTWKRVEAMLESRKIGYLDKKVSIDKDGLIAARDVLKSQGLADLGVKVEQEESFYLEPKRDDHEVSQ